MAKKIGVVLSGCGGSRASTISCRRLSNRPESPMRFLCFFLLAVLPCLPTTRAESTNEWADYNRDRVSQVVVGGKLVEKSKLTALTGFILQESAEVSISN